MHLDKRQRDKGVVKMVRDWRAPAPHHRMASSSTGKVRPPANDSPAIALGPFGAQPSPSSACAAWELDKTSSGVLFARRRSEYV